MIVKRYIVMFYVYFKAVGLNYADSRTARLSMESELLDMGIFDLADCCFRINNNFICVSVPKRQFTFLVSKVNNSRLFLSSHLDGDLLFTYSVSK